ncbi:nucleotidyltransferase domain-containing protein [Marinitenerispora sediminis]|uniref:Nucleotidyltransferase domain-containing protein n=1 Tax=Marinitenerispora sediminis TaxID=1931232 RepID=A0A368T3I0_9ACTN|nr:nucleotidyltransferase domain-containing protein [Marinitenerispora sediminis]RCV55852.1 nucleotidyltransferase domain-containing protein [Marinitenerispora sediminis]RCV56565.1 nucleotidyltransferase domain-containing protein [Marinitenerispora sediminis]RCV59403.1 nucleotidyltransferase domain-containing protein [Marinitenerispora sediminis]
MNAPLPPHIAELADQLAALPGAVAVVLGGSRAAGTHRPDSDWDLGVYYRASERAVDPEDLRRLGRPGYVSALGEWGPIVHGGGWLSVDGTPVDVLFRDLDRIERWAADAERGDFEVLTQTGYVVGAPTYLPVGELALGRPISGSVPRPEFSEALAAAAAEYWAGRAGVSLMFAGTHADAGDPVCCAGMLVDAVLSAAHSRLAARREWVLNEKRLVERAGLLDTRQLLAHPGGGRAALRETVAAVSTSLGITPPTPR